MTEVQEKCYLPLDPPSSLWQEDPHSSLVGDQQELYDKVLEHFTSPDYVLNSVGEKGELMEEEKFWLTRECILRFLRASKWKSSTAIERLEATLTWRREFGLYDVITANHVEPEAVTGKEIIFGYDTTNKPALYLIPSRQNTEESPRQIHYTFWALERCIDLMGPGVETITLLINFADKAKNPSFATSRTVLNILQDHYPERLGFSLIINVPFLISAFLKLIFPFVDPITREKIKINPQVFQDGIFTPDMVMSSGWGGERDFEYVHEKYWPTLIRMAHERKNRWMERWRSLGGTVGLKEWDYKRDDDVKMELDIARESPVTSPDASAL